MKKFLFPSLFIALMILLISSTALADAVSTPLFSVDIPDGWSFDEDWMSDDDEHCYVSFVMDDRDDSFYSAQVDITCDVNIPGNFAQKMGLAGLDTKSALTENTCDTKNIGGVDCWIADKGNSISYFGYLPGKNGFIVIEVYADEDAAEAVEALLNSVSFSFPDYSGDVLPWYWEGTPYSAPACEAEINGHTLNTALLPIDAVVPCYSTTDAKMDMAGNKIYIYSDKQLRLYTLDGDALVFNTLIEIPFEPRTFAVDNDGSVFLSGFGKNLTKLTDGTETTLSSETDDIAIHPSKAWGVSYFSDSNFKKIDMATGNASEFSIPEISYLKNLFVTENYIIVDGQLEDGTLCVRVYDQDLNFKGQIDESNTSTGWFGGANAVAETSNGLIIFDLNVRNIYFLDTDFNLLRAAEFEEILGTHTPWPCAAITGEDGNVYLMATDYRPDGTCSETVVFRISGY